MAAVHIFRQPNLRQTLLAFGFSLLFASCVAAPETGQQSRAGIIVQHASGQLTTRCVTFEGEETNGEALLNLSNIPFVADVGNSLGSIVCSIEGEGCLFPEENCFCECSGLGACTYWSYFIMSEDQKWTYAPVGARMRNIHDGDLDAWVWGAGANSGGDLTLPDMQFEDVCES